MSKVWQAKQPRRSYGRTTPTIVRRSNRGLTRKPASHDLLPRDTARTLLLESVFCRLCFGICFLNCA